MKWYLPPESDFIVQPPSPREFPGPLTPPPPWNFQFPSWWRSGYFLEPHNVSLPLFPRIIDGGDYFFFRFKRGTVIRGKAVIWGRWLFQLLMLTKSRALIIFFYCVIVIPENIHTPPRMVLPIRPPHPIRISVPEGSYITPHPPGICYFLFHGLNLPHLEIIDLVPPKN